MNALKLSFFISGALLLLTGIAYAEDFEVWGDFSVNGGTYYYTRGSSEMGLLTPRCPCDTSINDSGECPFPGFYSDVNEGQVCYDQYFVMSMEAIYLSIPYTRSVAATPAFVVTKNGDAYIPTQGNGLILRSTDGPECYRVTVNSTGIQRSQITCP